jgi:poly-gamma-glutamate synthesis protein (capsule biosynthesis protein)
MAGTVPVAAAAIAAAASLATQWSQRAAAPRLNPSRLAAASPSAASPAAASPVGASPVAASPAAASPVVRQTARRQATPVSAPTARASQTSGVPEGMTLAASPRLPLSGVGPDDPWRLLNRRVPHWGVVGSAVPLPVRVFALAGETAGVRADQTFPDYEQLAAAMAREPGAVALIPTERVDFRVQALTVGDVDPLRETIAGGTPLRIGVVGDIVPGRNVHLHMVEYGDFTRPFLRVAPLLRSFDLTVANLEGNLSDTLPQPVDPHSFSFVSSPAMLEGFTLAGIDAVTLANNHTVWNSENWGVQGLLDTIAALEAHSLPYFGGGRDLAQARAAWVIEAAGTRVAFLGIDGVTANHEVPPSVQDGVLDFDAAAADGQPGTNPYVARQIAEDVTAAAAAADVVIPYFHFGAEYVGVVPSWAGEAARAAIDAGATMVVTNHPHVVQGMEIHAGKPIVYSPGNFIFDQMFAAEVRSGLALEIVLRGSRVVGLRYHGIEIEDFHQPRLTTAGEQAAIMDRFWASTDRLAARDGGAT